jgi:hypothetical protein
MEFCRCLRFKIGSQPGKCGGCSKQKRPRGSKFCVVCRVNVGAASAKRASYVDAALGVVQFCYGCSLARQPALHPFKFGEQPRPLIQASTSLRILDNEVVAVGDFPLPTSWAAACFSVAYRRAMAASYRKASSHASSAPIFIGGSTAGAAQHEQQFQGPDGQPHMLPRLNAMCRPGTAGHAHMQLPEVRSMATTAAAITLQWAQQHRPLLAKRLHRAKDLIPAELRYGSTFWTAMTMVGDLRCVQKSEEILQKVCDILSKVCVPLPAPVGTTSTWTRTTSLA